MNEALKKNEKYQKRYMKRHKMLCVLLSKENDKDIIDWLGTQENASESVRWSSGKKCNIHSAS